MNSTALMNPPHPISNLNTKDKPSSALRHLREMAPEALIYTFLAKSVCSQDHEDAAGRLGKALTHAHPDECPKVMSSWARVWIEAEVISQKDVLATAKKVCPRNVARILASAMDITLQGFCSTARSMEYLRMIQAAMPTPDYPRPVDLRVVE